MNGIRPRMRIVGVSGVFVGTVREVAEDRFLVAPADSESPVYWLKAEAIVGVEGNRVELICGANEVHRYLTDPPAAG